MDAAFLTAKISWMFMVAGGLIGFSIATWKRDIRWIVAALPGTLGCLVAIGWMFWELP